MTKTNKSGPRYYGDPNMLINLRNHQEIFDTRTMNRLKNDEIVFLGDLLHRSENDMLSAPNFGKKSLNELKEFLQNIGHYNFVSKGYVSRGVTFGDDKSKIIEFYGLENDAQPTWIPSKPKPLGQSSVTNEQKTPPIFTKEDFNLSAFQSHDTPESNIGFELVFHIGLPQSFNNLAQDNFIKLDDGEIYDQIIEKTKANHFVYNKEGYIEIDYRHENGMQDLVSMDVLQAFVDVANVIYLTALEHAKQSAKDEAKESFSKKMQRYGITPPQ